MAARDIPSPGSTGLCDQTQDRIACAMPLPLEHEVDTLTDQLGL
jgi:hypothetical protein